MLIQHALRDPEAARQLARSYPGAVVVGLDLKEGRAATDGWTRAGATGEEFLAEEANRPFAAAIVTDIDRDGCLQGPNLSLYQRLVETSLLPIVASGGVSTLDDLVSLARFGLAGMVVGKALYEGRFDLRDAIRASEGASCTQDPDSYNAGSTPPEEPEEQ